MGLTDRAARGGARAAEALRGDAGALLGGFGLVALLMSTEFLFQPFVWRNYPALEIVNAWAGVAGQRLLVALPIAVGLAFARREPRRGGVVRRGAFSALAVVAGATLGELALASLAADWDRDDLVSVFGRIVRWSLLGGVVVVMTSLWRARSDLARASQAAKEADLRARRLLSSTRLEALQRQIEPHFLFNTLATIRRLQQIDPAAGGRMLDRLLRFMGAALAADPGRVATLGDELELVVAYLEVCASRMGGRLDVQVEVAADLRGLNFPPLVLATLAENAIKHGVSPKDAGCVAIKACRIDRGVELTLSDDGAGFVAEAGGGGIGLSNARERLRLTYGPAAELRLQVRRPCGVIARVFIPAAAL